MALNGDAASGTTGSSNLAELTAPTLRPRNFGMPWNGIEESPMLSEEEIKEIKENHSSLLVCGFDHEDTELLHQHVDALLQDREELKQQLAEARAVIEFYADDPSIDYCGDTYEQSDVDGTLSVVGSKACEFLTQYPEESK